MYKYTGEGKERKDFFLKFILINTLEREKKEKFFLKFILKFMWDWKRTPEREKKEKFFLKKLLKFMWDWKINGKEMEECT